MERVAFIVEQTGDRIDALLNPESVVVRRWAGLDPRPVAEGRLSRDGAADDPLLATGGGRTELTLDLLFDTQLAGLHRLTDDVRTLTGPLWDLSENQEHATGQRRPPRVRFVWGRAWNVPVVVAAVAERLEHFDGDGVPRRSWLRLRLLRVAEAGVAEPRRPIPLAEIRRILDAVAALDPTTMRTHAVPRGAGSAYVGGQRLDLIAARYYGDPALWRVLAMLNGIDDPLELAPGTVLRVPALPWMKEAEPWG